MSAYYVPGTILDPEDISVMKNNKDHCPHAIIFQWWGIENKQQKVNYTVYQMMVSAMEETKQVKADKKCYEKGVGSRKFSLT